MLLFIWFIGFWVYHEDNFFAYNLDVMYNSSIMFHVISSPLHYLLRTPKCKQELVTQKISRAN